MECIKTTSNNHVARQGPRSIKGATRALVMFMANFLKGYDVGAHNSIIEKTLSRKILIGMVPLYLCDTKLLRHS